MNNIILLMYSADLFSSIGLVLLFIVIALFLLLVVLAINYSDACSDQGKMKIEGMSKTALKHMVIYLVILILLPSSRTINTLIATTAIKELSTIQSVNVIGNKAMKVIDSYLDKVIKENTDKLTEETK